MMKWYRQTLYCAMMTLIPAAVLAFPGAGGGKKESAPPLTVPKEEPTAAPDATPPAAAEKKEKLPTHVGKVLETLNGGGYTYVYLEKKGGEKHWYAVPETKVTVGQELELMPGIEMGKFTSRALDRTFDSINFSGGVVVNEDAEKLKKAHAGVAGDEKEKKGEAEEAPIKVEKATGANAYTIEEVYAKKGELAGKGIAVRGKVVKVSEGVMNKNWVHLRDGSGKSATGNNDLLATSLDLPAVGDVVTVSGDLSVDKDFGSGYKYGIIIEDAKIKK